MCDIICSIIIAARNEADFIGGCIETLENQDLDRSSYEIIIIDGLSEDNTVGIASEKQKIYGNIHLFTNPKKIASSAFNIGIRNSAGEYVFIVGAHAVYPPDFIRKSVESLQENNADCIGGREIDISRSKLGEIFSGVRNTPFGGGLSPYRYSGKKQFVKTVAFGCYKKDTLIKAGCFDEALVRNQDNDINKRIIKMGGKIIFDPSIRFYYFPRDTIKGIFKQLYGYGYWEAKLIKKQKSQFSMLALVPSVFVIYTLMALVYMLIEGSPLFLCLEFIPYIAIFSYFALKVLLPKRLNMVIALFLYLFIHFSIGLGFLAGLFWRTEGNG